MRRGVRLGVDVGSVRVGLAASDPSGMLASPVETLPRDERGGSDLHEIARQVTDREALEVIVGHPVQLDGRTGTAAGLARGYAEALARLVAPVAVRLVDERLSTVTAHQQLHQAGVKGRGHRRVIDQVAAVVVLQNALDAERASGRVPGIVVVPGGAPDPPTPE